MKEIFCLFILITFVSCSDLMQNDTEHSSKHTTTRAYAGDSVDFFLMGQSNANGWLADNIAQVTGKTITQINHSGKPIESWFIPKYNYIEKDKSFLGGKSVKYFIWFQGEANYKSYENYSDYFGAILYELFGDSQPTILVIQVYSGAVDMSEFREYQKEMCDQNGYYLIDSSDCERNAVDYLHLDSVGWGQLAEKIDNLIGGLEQK